MENETHNNAQKRQYGVKCRDPKEGYICSLKWGHTGRHEAWGSSGRMFLAWPYYANYSHVVDEEVAAIKKQTTVLLTLEDLKAIAFFLSDSGVDAVPDTVAKIDKALKEML